MINKNVIKIMFGSSAGQLLAFVMMIGVSRSFGPSKIGHFNYIYSIATLIAVLLTVRIESALSVEDDLKKANTLFKALCVLAFVLCSIAYVAMKIAASVHLFSSDTLFSQSFGSICLIALLVSLLNIIQLYYIRSKCYGAMAFQSFFSPVSVVMFQFFFSFYSDSFEALIWSAFAGRLLFLLFLLVFYRPDVKDPVCLIGGLESLKRNIKYGATVCLSYLANSSLIMLIPILSMWLYGPKETGLISLAYRLVVAPSMIVAQSFAQVFYADFSDAFRNKEDNLLHIVYKNVAILFLVGSVGFGIAYFISPYLVLLLGKKWVGVEYYFRLFLPAFFIQFSIGPIKNGLNVIGKQRLLLILSLIGLALFLAGVSIIDYFELTGIYYVFVVDLAIALYYGSILFFLCKCLRQPEKMGVTLNA